VTRILTAADVEAAAQQQLRSLAVPADTIVTPLALDRARALRVGLGEPASDSGGAPPAPPRPSRRSQTTLGGASAADIAWLVVESRVRTIARRLILREYRNLALLDDVVDDVMSRLQDSAGAPHCRCHESER
jgi:hypothetical protein